MRQRRSGGAANLKLFLVVASREADAWWGMTTSDRQDQVLTVRCVQSPQVHNRHQSHRRTSFLCNQTSAPRQVHVHVLMWSTRKDCMCGCRTEAIFIWQLISYIQDILISFPRQCVLAWQGSPLWQTQ